MAKITYTDLKTIASDLMKEQVGLSPSGDETIDLSAVISQAKATVGDVREKLLGSFIVHIAKRYYKDEALNIMKNNPFWVDSEDFGAILEAVSIKLPSIAENSAYKSFTSGTTTVGEYTIVLPEVDAKYYLNGTSWGLPMSFKDDQLKDAMRSEADLLAFANYVRNAIQNSIELHQKSITDACRNSYIAHKINYTKYASATGVHVVNLSAEYNNAFAPATGMTVAEQLNDEDVTLFFKQRIKFYNDMISEPTTQFNIGGNVRWLSSDNRVCQFIGAFVDKLETTASNIRHNYITLPEHQRIPFWQKTKSFAWSDLTNIDIKIDGSASMHETTTGVAEEINISNIVGLICDKRCALTTRISNRTGVQSFPIENLVHTEYQEVSKYCNMLDLNGVVFVLADILDPIS